jgi:hypothetical protein
LIPRRRVDVTLSREELLSLRARTEDRNLREDCILSRGAVVALVDEVLELRRRIATLERQEEPNVRD